MAAVKRMIQTHRGERARRTRSRCDRCWRICMHRKCINVSTALAGQRVGIKEVDEGIWIDCSPARAQPRADSKRLLRVTYPPVAFGAAVRDQEGGTGMKVPRIHTKPQKASPRTASRALRFDQMQVRFNWAWLADVYPLKRRMQRIEQIV